MPTVYCLCWSPKKIGQGDEGREYFKIILMIFVIERLVIVNDGKTNFLPNTNDLRLSKEVQAVLNKAQYVLGSSFSLRHCVMDWNPCWEVTTRAGGGFL